MTTGDWPPEGPPAGEPMLLLTGMSGAGRSTAANVLEDLGWYVVDNLPPQLLAAMTDLRSVGVDILTVGQYLRPSLRHLSLERYYHPDEFAEMKVEALAMGFKHVESGPLVRSSYHARDQVPGAELKRLRRQATIDADGRVVPLAG